VVNEAGRRRLQSKQVIEVLPAEARVWLGLSGKAVRSEFHRRFSGVG